MEDRGIRARAEREPTGVDTLGAFFTYTTDSVPIAERLDFWRESVMRRLSPAGRAPDGGSFRGRLNRTQGEDAEMLDVASDAWTAKRDKERCRRDGYDDISFNLLVAGLAIHRSATEERSLRPGDLSLVDVAQPVEMLRARHRVISLIVSRDRFQLPARFPLRLRGAHGLASLLRSHLRLTADLVPNLSPQQRALAIRIATDLAFAVLETETNGGFDADRFCLGLYEGARRMIERECADPEFGPLQLAALLSCSRATLYRAFSTRGESVAAMIWNTRLEQAQRALTCPGHAELTIGEIAFRSGFLDHPTFNRMFKRRYGMTPREARHASSASAESGSQITVSSNPTRRV
jgi:AraC family transcriptional regulator, positive regulator of tynA and feaB